jgi:hypothetical protein
MGMAESIIEKARGTQLRNIESKTGTTMAELRRVIRASGLARHGEIRDMLKERFGLGHGDANAAVHFALASELHARGPMGLRELTTQKYVVHGDGQTRG